MPTRRERIVMDAWVEVAPFAGPVEVTDDEATPDASYRICLDEIQQALAADSREHMLMHLESAVIWGRGMVEGS